MPRLAMSEVLRAVLGVTISCFFVRFLLTKIKLSLVIGLLLNASPRWIAAGVMFLSADYLFRAIRWWLMIRRHSPEVTLGATLCALLASFAANNVLPLRAGDVMRAFWFSRRLGSSSGFLLGTLILERGLDLLTLLTMWLILITMTHFHLPHPGLIRFVACLTIMCVLGLATVLTMATTIESLLMRAVRALFGERPIIAKIMHGVRPVFAVFKSCRPRFVLELAALSGAVWVLEGSVFWMAAMALRLPTVTTGPWLAFILGNFAAMIPSAPGYVGTFHAAVITALVTVGCEPNIAASFAILVHALIWIWITLAGTVAYFLASGQTQESSGDIVVSIPTELSERGILDR